LRGLYTGDSTSKAQADPSSKLYPDIEGPADVRSWARVSPTYMPIVFTVAWLLVLGRLLTAWLNG
jgi:hypothetical protein